MAEDEMVWCQVECPLDLVASTDEFDVVYLRPVSVSLTARPQALLWLSAFSPWLVEFSAYSDMDSV